MADFLEKLTDILESRRADIQQQLAGGSDDWEEALAALTRAHWQPLPEVPARPMCPAVAVDGSVHQVNLDSGGYLIVAQALALGADLEEPSVDVQVLPSGTPPDVAADIKDLCQSLRELSLSCEVVARVAPGSVLFRDGALYGLLPLLGPRKQSAIAERLRTGVLNAYLDLLDSAARRGVRLVAVSKTSREATHAALWLAAQDRAAPAVLDQISDADLIHRWTDMAAGLSVPVILGSQGFTSGQRDLLQRADVAASPAIVSFFARLADYDDALRIDVPAHQVGHAARLVDLEAGVLPDGCLVVHETVGLLQADYGGLEVYNALLYSVDREVRLRRDMVLGVYLPLIEELTGVPIRRNRSERRF